MNAGLGWMLVGRDAERDPGAWFIFHHGSEGTLAVDLTKTHPQISYRHFENTLDFEDTKPDDEKIVLRGGPERPDDALLILHERAGATEESLLLNDDFAIQTYTFVLLPGKPPALLTTTNAPGRIHLKPRARCLIVMGFRQWVGESLAQEIAEGRWTCLPASPDTVLSTPHAQLRGAVLNAIN